MAERQEVNWIETTAGDPHAVELMSRHYSAASRRMCGPGERLSLVTLFGAAALCVVRQQYHQVRPGLWCTFFRNEGPLLSSLLLREAAPLIWRRWPDEDSVLTFVDPAAIRSTNPGYCFKVAGWRDVTDQVETRRLRVLELRR